MDILTQIIGSMNKEEVRFFKLFEAGMTSDDRKDLYLFNYIRSHPEDYDEQIIFEKLYGKGSKNPFYRLKNRLLYDIARSLHLQHFEKEENISAMNLLSLAHLFLLKNKPDIAGYFLKRAEKKAQKSGSLELLDIIYGEYIKLSQAKTAINPEIYIAKRKKNREQIDLLRQLDDILALVTYQLRITQNFKPGKNPVLDLLQKTVNKVSKNRKLLQSPELRFRLYHSVSQLLLQRRDYVSLESYLLNIYREFEKEKLFGKSNHDTKLQILTYIVNALFKNGKYRESLRFAELLRKNMEGFHHLLYDKYFFFYYNALVINYSKLDPHKAINILEDLKENSKIKTNGFYMVFVYLNLIVLNFDLKEYRTAIRYLNKLYLLNDYRTTDISIRFRIAMAELIIRYELKDFDLLEYKILRARKEFQNYLALPENEKDREFIRLLRKIINAADFRKDKKLVEQVRKFLTAYPADEADDHEIISYNGWLRQLLHP
jgi:hypothetical protein